MPASPNFSVQGKVVSAIKLAGSTRVKVTIAIPDGPNRSHSVLAFEHDSATIGDAYTGLAPGTGCTISVSVP